MARARKWYATFVVEQPKSEPVRVEVIEIEGLFRQYNHHIALRADDRVTILHGRNGVGKTVSLSLVESLLQGKYGGLTKPPFKRLRLVFTDDSSLEARQTERESDRPQTQKAQGRKGAKQGSRAKPKAPIELVLSRMGTDPETFPVAARHEAPAPLWPDDGFVVTGGERGGRDETPEEPPKVKAARSRVPVHFIEAQRLFKITGYVTTAVRDIAANMVERIKEADSMYRATSTRLDETLPARLFSTDPTLAQPISERDLRRRTMELESERERLRAIGLVGDASTSFDPNRLDGARRAMFAVYLADNEEKLAAFKDLADRAQILLEIVNHKFAPKRVKLDKDHGFEILSHDGRPLDLDALSSGEQHELVLLHNLLFRVEPGALLLIDEPELSLHVTWQREFLSDLIKIAKRVGFDAIVATHSPYIVGERRDLMVQLGEPV